MYIIVNFFSTQKLDSWYLHRLVNFQHCSSKYHFFCGIICPLLTNTHKKKKKHNINNTSCKYLTVTFTNDGTLLLRVSWKFRIAFTSSRDETFEVKNTFTIIETVLGNKEENKKWSSRNTYGSRFIWTLYIVFLKQTFMQCLEQNNTYIWKNRRRNTKKPLKPSIEKETVLIY